MNGAKKMLARGNFLWNAGIFLFSAQSMIEAFEAYGLSEDEFLSWVRAIAEHGEEALRTTAIQKDKQP